jgi:hypothetical protein
MKFLKSKSAPRPVVALERGQPLADRIKQVRDEAEAVIEARVDSEKAQHPTLPRDWILLNQFALARADKGRCACRCALKILGEQEHDG